MPATPTFPPPRSPTLTILNNALRYLLFREDIALTAVRDEVNRIGGPLDRGDPDGQTLLFAQRALHYALAYDWLYDAMAPGDRATLQAYLESYAEYAMLHEPADVFSSEAYAQAATVGLVGLALAAPADTPMSPATRYLAYANNRWRNVLLPTMGYARGWWPEGPAWFNAFAGRYALYFTIAWSTATGEDLVTWARTTAGDPFGGMVDYVAYGLRPDMRFPTFGDALGDPPPNAAGTRAVLDLLAWATGSPVAQSLANEVTLRLPVGQDYQGSEAWHQVVFYDPQRPTQPARADLPLAAHLGPRSADVVVMRGAWQDEGAVHVALSCGDWFTRRQHLEAGSFQVFRSAPLLTHTGTWDGYETRHWLNWYAQRSVHANTLAVVRPGETFPNARMIPSVNDGGQRAMPYAGRGRASLTEYRGNLTAGEQFDTGAVTAFETSRYHDYAACDITRAYNSTAVTAAGAAPKLREVTRQVVLLRPELLVVFDRVESTDPTYDRRFVVHGLSTPVPDRDGLISLTRGAGRMIGRTLLPTVATREVVQGYRVGDVDLTPLVPLDEGRGARLEVTAPRGQAREYFLHVFDFTDTLREAPPPMTLIDEGDTAGVRVGDPSMERTYTLTFARTGEPRGDLRVLDARGAELYRGALGRGGTFFPVVQDAGVTEPDASQPLPDGGPVTPPPVQPGCSCRTSPHENGRLGAVASLLMLWGLGRRRRSPRG